MIQLLHNRQATKCPGEISRSSGLSRSQPSNFAKQREQNRQPSGGLIVDAHHAGADDEFADILAAHRDWPGAFELLRGVLRKEFEPMFTHPWKKKNTQRRAKFRSMGEFALAHAPSSASDEHTGEAPSA